MNRVWMAMVLGGWSAVSLAGNIDGVNTLSQSEFALLSEDLAAAFSYKAGAAAEPLGTTGFDVGVAVSVTDLADHKAVWDKAVGGGLDALIVPKLYLQKGLPFDIDVGAYFTTVPGSNVKAWGAEIKYAIIDGGMALPAVAVRASATSLFGADQFTLKTQAVDVSISKGFAMLTPYAGLGQVWSTNTPEGNASGLQKVDTSEARAFIGAVFTPGIVSLAVEADSVGGVSSYNIKFGVAF